MFTILSYFKLISTYVCLLSSLSKLSDLTFGMWGTQCLGIWSLAVSVQIGWKWGWIWGMWKALYPLDLTPPLSPYPSD